MRRTVVLRMTIALLLVWLLASCAGGGQQQTAGQRAEGQKQGTMTVAQDSANQQQARQEERSCSSLPTLSAEDSKPNEAPNSTIVFQTRSGPRSAPAAESEEIWIMNASGSDLRRLTDRVSQDSVGWSVCPNGEKIAFATERTEEVPCNSQAGCPMKFHAQINVMNVDGSEQTKLVEKSGNLSSPDWSPDGKQIAFGSSDADARRCEIYTMDASGRGDPAHLTDFDGCYGIDSVAWSPDGKKIVIEVLEVGLGLGDNDIYVVDVPAEGRLFGSAFLGNLLAHLLRITSQPRQLTQGAHKWWNVDPTWSPDSTEIAFIHMDTADMEPHWPVMAKMNADGSSKTQLVSDRSLAPRLPFYDGNSCQRPTEAIPPTQNLAWSPDGEKLAFVGNGNFVCVVNADGSGEPTLIRRFNSEVSNLQWLPST